MTHAPTHGATLLELVVALTILSGLALATAPVAARTGDLQARGRALLEGAHLGATRRARSEQLPCGTTDAGTDTTRRAVLSWQIVPVDSTLVLTGVILDPGARWAPETLTTVLKCQP